MYKILIADDEEIEINAFKVMVGNNFDNVTVISAENGIEAVEAVLSEKPDIVFMDIEMPGINGLTAIETVKKTLPDTHFIVHTAYSNFNYAQRAVKVGADDYLLKPVKMDMLIETIKRIIEIIEQKRSSFSEFQQIKDKFAQFQPFIEKDIIYSVVNGVEGHEILTQYAEMLNIKMKRAFCAIFSVVTVNESDNSIENSLVNKSKAAKEVVNILKQVCQCITAEYTCGHVLAIIPFENNAEEYDIRKWSINLANYVCNRCKKFTQLRVGIGGLCTDFSNIHASYIEAYKSMTEDASDISVKHFEDIKSTPQSETVTLSYYENLISKAIAMRDKQEASRLAVLIFNMIIKEQNNIPYIKLRLFETCAVIRRAIENNTINSVVIRGNQDLGFLTSITSLPALQNWFFDFIRDAVNELGKVSNKRNSYIVSEVKKYIDQNYEKEISLEDVAATICVTPYYLSRLFKKEMNDNFNAYLTQVRIEKAKQLLRNTNKTIKEITYETGFNSQAYFCRVFKKLEKVSPTEYIQSIADR